MSRNGRIIYAGKTATTGGREDGASRSSDGLLDIRFSEPGSVRIGTNPEQLLAAAWSASFASSIASVAQRQKIALPARVSVNAEVALNLGDDGYFLTTRLNIRLPGIEQNAARGLIDQAHEICPYSKATRGNVQTSISLL